MTTNVSINNDRNEFFSECNTLHTYAQSHTIFFLIIFIQYTFLRLKANDSVKRSIWQVHKICEMYADKKGEVYFPNIKTN